MYFDLEDEQPKAPGVYTVQIQTPEGVIIKKAQWTTNGFVLIDAELGAEDYIFGWK